ncbi:MAG: hypothetical protein KW802_01390 [Candidatus Doudnabacteria bacterium]|nr:hypothetical protein [Candidatus Doudnabacteria bacterium]
MDTDRWEQIKENIKSKFPVLEEGTEDLMVPTAEGDVKNGKAEFIVAQTPLGKIKLVFESRPVVLDKKTIYSHRAGQAARNEYEFSESEFSHKVKAYKWNDDEDEWKEIDAATFSN